MSKNQLFSATILSCVLSLSLLHCHDEKAEGSLAPFQPNTNNTNSQQETGSGGSAESVNVPDTPSPSQPDSGINATANTGDHQSPSANSANSAKPLQDKMAEMCASVGAEKYEWVSDCNQLTIKSVIKAKCSGGNHDDMQLAKHKAHLLCNNPEILPEHLEFYAVVNSSRQQLANDLKNHNLTVSQYFHRQEAIKEIVQLTRQTPGAYSLYLMGDQDRDLIPDPIDLCPNTPHRDAVDAHGCTRSNQNDEMAEAPDMAELDVLLNGFRYIFSPLCADAKTPPTPRVFKSLVAIAAQGANDSEKRILSDVYFTHQQHQSSCPVFYEIETAIGNVPDGAMVKRVLLSPDEVPFVTDSNGAQYYLHAEFLAQNSDGSFSQSSWQLSPAEHIITPPSQAIASVRIRAVNGKGDASEWTDIPGDGTILWKGP